MKTIYTLAIATIVAIIVVAVAFAPGWSYKVNAVRFAPSNPPPKSDDPVPGLWIDTHVEIDGMFGGTIESEAPYDVAFDYTDLDHAYSSLEWTSVTITYDDEVVEKLTDKLKLPIRIDAFEYEAVNSVGDKVVKSKLMLLSGKIEKVISRDQPFTLELKGHFNKQDGTKVPFEIEQHYDVKKDTETLSWSEVMGGE